MTSHETEPNCDFNIFYTIQAFPLSMFVFTSFGSILCSIRVITFLVLFSKIVTFSVVVKKQNQFENQLDLL